MKKTKIYSGIAGAMIGGIVGTTVGRELSPNRESDNFNKNLGTGTGAILGALSGVYIGKQFYVEDPENYKGDPIKIDYKKDINKKEKLIPLNNSEIDLSQLGIKLDAIPSHSSSINTTSELPAKYHSDVYKQVVIRHKVPSKKIKLKDGRSFILKETELIEHKFVE